MRESKDERNFRQAVERTQFIDVLRRAGNEVEEEVRFHPERRWRIDLLITPKPREVSYLAMLPVALEIEGRGRHQSFYGYSADMEKYNEVTIAGFRLLRVTRDMIGDGDALDVLARAGVNVVASSSGAE